jgi:hypothetical protein
MEWHHSRHTLLVINPKHLDRIHKRLANHNSHHHNQVLSNVNTIVSTDWKKPKKTRSLNPLKINLFRTKRISSKLTLTDIQSSTQKSCCTYPRREFNQLYKQLTIMHINSDSELHRSIQLQPSVVESSFS